MTDVIRVLALNDDNHETSFHLENGTKYTTHMEFIRELAKPHECIYEVRCIYLLNLRIGDWAETAFDMVQYGTINNFEYDLAFEHLWRISTETMFGGW